MKTRLLQIIYANPFGGVNYEDLYNYRTKFYEIHGTLKTQEQAKEEILSFINFFQKGFGQATSNFVDFSFYY